MTILASSIIGSSSGGLIMPSISTTITGDPRMKSAAGTVSESNMSDFWTAIDLSHTALGYESKSLSAAANTSEQTVLDISGSGVLTHVLAPGLSGSGIMTVRISIDGAEKEFTSETLAADNRFMVGGFMWFAPTSTASSSVGVGSAQDGGYSIGRQTTMTTPHQAIVDGIGMVYSSSVKVTIQGSVNITSTAELLKAAACYSLTIPRGVL